MTSSSIESLKTLPHSIWIPSASVNKDVIYRGTPVQIIGEMIPKPLVNHTLRRKVSYLLHDLAKRRALVIGLPDNVADEVYAGLFVFALLDVGIARPAMLA